MSLPTNPTINYKKSSMTNLRRCIHRPTELTRIEFSKLDAEAHDLIAFHRSGFGVREDEYFDEFLIDEVLKSQDKLHK